MGHILELHSYTVKKRFRSITINLICLNENLFQVIKIYFKTDIKCLEVFIILFKYTKIGEKELQSYFQ